MPSPKYQFTTYTSAQNALNTIDTWLVSVMGYTRNLAPTADSVTYTGYKAHYQFTFVTGETIYLNFHTDTTNSRLYLTTSRAYASASNWNAQTGTASVQSGAIIYGYLNIPTAATNNSMYLFGDTYGNCQVFVQEGADISVSDFMQWGMLNKTGFGTWQGGCYFDSWNISRTTLGFNNSGPSIINSSKDSSKYGAVDITVDGITDWALIKSLAGCTSNNLLEPVYPLVSGSADYSHIIVGHGLSATCNLLTNYNPGILSNDVEDIISGYVNQMTGKIVFGQPPTLFVRHEATKRISPIGRVPFGYHCPIAGAYQYVAPGTQLVQDGRTFILIGNIAAEMVSV